MTRQVHIQVKAKSDLTKIWQYSFEQFGLKQADSYFDDLIEATNALKDNPQIGEPCDEIRQGYRKFKVNRHFIFYRVTKQKIHIIRVLHEIMLFGRHM